MVENQPTENPEGHWLFRERNNNLKKEHKKIVTV